MGSGTGGGLMGKKVDWAIAVFARRTIAIKLAVISRCTWVVINDPLQKYLPDGRAAHARRRVGQRRLAQNYRALRRTAHASRRPICMKRDWKGKFANDRRQW